MSILWDCHNWLRDQVHSRVQAAIIAILVAGPIPQHVAFVMDGNRRYARQKNIKIQEGHSEGYVALHRMLEICMRLNVRCVTAYTFSIENFKRSPDEVDALMTLAEAKLLELCQHGSLLNEYGVRLNVLGKTELLPPKVRAAIRQAHDKTRHNDRAILNLCMPYTARDDITTAVQSTVQDAMKEGRDPHSIGEKDIDDHLMTTAAGSPPLDILIRTSGVKRLSDFLLWQCCENTQIQFTSTYWPDFTLWDFIPIMLDYQRKVWSRTDPCAGQTH